MNIQLREKKKSLIFDINEDINRENAEELEAFINNNISTEKDVVINLEKVTYINSFTLGTFIKIQNDLKEKETSLYFLHVNPSIKALFKVSGVLQYFSLIDDEKDLK